MKPKQRFTWNKVANKAVKGLEMGLNMTVFLSVVFIVLAITMKPVSYFVSWLWNLY